MAIEDMLRGARLDIPNARGIVPRARRRTLSVRRKGDGRDGSAMVVPSVEQRAAPGVPEARDAFIGANDDLRAIGRKSGDFGGFASLRQQTDQPVGRNLP